MGVEQIVAGLLQLVAAIAPGVLALATGHESDEQAIETMTGLVVKLPQRTGPHGTWAADLAKRKSDGDDS